MPPFIPKKRQSSEEPPPPKRHAAATATPTVSPARSSLTPISDSSLTPVPTDVDIAVTDENDKELSDSDDAESDEVDWEDAIEPAAPASAAATNFVSPQDNLELTLDRNEVHLEDILQGQKAPSKIERQIRILIHRLHVQCLLAHNAIRNDWANDLKCHEILLEKLPPAIQKEIQKWRRASGLEPPEPPKEPMQKKKKGKQSKRQAKSQRDWGENSSRQEPGQPDLSNGDPIIHLMRILAAYWKSKFKITAPSLRKHGYRPMAQLQTQIASFNKDKHDPAQFGEKIESVEEFREAAKRMEGSRDLGAQLFTALLRALKLEARLVASLQPLGFGWTKAETHTAPKSKEKSQDKDSLDAEDLLDSEDEDDEVEVRPSSRKPAKRFDHDLPFPTYWTEVASPITHRVVSVDPIVLPNAVAATQDLQSAWEPRGAKADKAKQVICYVIAFSADKTAKEVTTRYLRRRTWPGKTKGFRLGKKGPDDDPRDWFRLVLHLYERPHKDRTAVDDIEDAQDLVPNRPQKAKPNTESVDTLQSLRTSTEFVLERFLRREEALRPGAQPVRTFTPGGKKKAAPKSKTNSPATPTATPPPAENVYRRSDIVKCQSAESWHKEGREPRPAEVPLKRVPIRAVTLLRKREVDEHARQTGQKPLQGLYSIEQTQEIIPPPIVDGIIPKNNYGNIDCFAPRMVPEGAVHIPFPGTARICKKLGIDYAEAVTGFEFGSQMAVPVIEGVVVAVENEDLVKDAWRADNEEKRRKEARKAEAKILATWRKFLFGMRIAQRVKEEYADEEEGGDLPDAYNPFASRKGKSTGTPGTPAEAAARSGSRPVGLVDEDEEMDDADARGGGFLLGGDDDGDAGDLIVEERAPPVRRARRIAKDESSVPDPEEEEDDTAASGGGFLLDGDDEGDAGGLIVVERNQPVRRVRKVTRAQTPILDSDDDNELSSVPESSEEELSPPPQKRRRTRGTKRS
ncbi:Rad4 transglutaminase-like domain-containing protein [Aspergillus karnatakaensis]|uniref:Rad4 family protein n=1 Tax=Aspergillus karnatakaensis TaxID=1810916 RepID=UPI003CCD2BEF